MKEELRVFKLWTYSIMSSIILFTVIYSIVTNSKEVNNVVKTLVGPLANLIMTIIECLTVLVIAGTVLIICYCGILIYGKLKHSEISEIGQYGSVIVSHNRSTVINPYSVTEVKELKREKVKEIEAPKKILTMRELLITGYLPSLIRNGEMLLGYDETDLIERRGTIEDNRTTGIAGKSRSGKTVTMAFLILQYVLAHGQVFLIDKNWNKASSLYKLLQPLIEAGYIKAAKTPIQIVDITDGFTNILDDREKNENSDMSTTCLFVIDEWTGYMSDKIMMKKLVSIVHRITNQAAGFNCYAMIAGQNWQASQAGGNALINSLHSFFVHKIDFMESKKLLERRYSTKTDTLKTGTNFFKDTSGDTQKLVTPLVTVDDAHLVLAILEGKLFAGTQVSNFYNPLEYQQTFKSYNPKLLTTSKEEIVASKDTTPLASSGISDISTRETKEMIPTLVSEDGKIRVSSQEQAIIKAAIDKAILDGKVKNDGTVVRTYVRDILGYDNREYKKVELFCNANKY